MHSEKITEVSNLQNRLLESILVMQNDFIKRGIYYGWCKDTIENLLFLSESEFGFICELLKKDDGTPYIKSHGITNIAWDEQTRQFYEENKEKGLEFFNFESLWGKAITTGEPVIANDPDNDNRRGGYPKDNGHPKLKSFLGLPVKGSEGEIVGVMGIANRPNGYDQEMVDFLSPFLSSYGMLIEKYRSDEQRKKLEVEHQKLISDLKYNQETLKKNKALLDATGRMAKVGGWELDADTMEVTWPNETYRIHEVPVGQKPSLEETINFFHPEDRPQLEQAIQRALNHGEPYDMEIRFITAKGKHLWTRTICRPETRNGKTVKLQGTFQDITERKKTEEEMKKIQWLLEKEKVESQKTVKNYIPDYGDVTKLNTERTILDNVGAETLKILCADIMDLLDTSIAIYEKNGDYAFGQFDSTWCQAMDLASFRVCNTQDKKEALNCGKWLCHENCWNDSAKEAIKTQKTTDIKCVGGIHLYAVPIYAGENIIGVINMGYGNPPTDEITLKELAEEFHVEYQVLIENATKYKARPPFIIDNAKKRLHTIAQLIGQIVDSVQKEKQIKKAKEKAENSEIKLKHIIENSTNLFYSHTADHVITFVSPQVRDLLGYEPEEVMRRWTELVTDNPINEEGFKRTKEAIKTGKRQPTYHLELERKDSKKITVEVREAPVTENGKVVSIVGSLADVTERKQAEDALDKSHERLLAVLNSIDATIHVADMQNYEVLFMNKYMIDSFGGDMTGETCWKALRGESGPCSYCHNDQLVDENGKPTGVYSWQGQNPITGKWYINYDRAIEWTDGRLVKIQIATDITEMKQMEDQLRQAHKMESIGTLAGGIAHEFNNMLGIIIGNTELAIDDVPEWNPAKDCLEEIRTASLRAKDVVRQIMSFSRKTPATRIPVQISTIIQESLKLMRATIPTNIEVNQEILCNNEMILANPTEINQILMNLCSNAVHAMGNETGLLRVRLEKADLDHQNAAGYEDLTPGKYVKLTVEDNGSGVDSTIMASIFDPYFTTKDVDKGLGMGLAVVYGIVKKHDGAIHIKSQLGVGTTAEVLFPITEDLPEKDSQIRADLRMGTETILLVDDEPSLVKMVSQILEKQGYSVVGKTSSTEALKAFEKEPDHFDLVISDMAMPEMPGDILVVELLKIRPSVPIILCTGHSDRIDKKRAKALGVADYSMKPYEKRELVRKVRRVLDEAKGYSHD